MTGFAKGFKSIVPTGLWGPAYRIGRGDWMRRLRFYRRNVGTGSYLDPSVQILGVRNVRIGRSTVVSEDVWFNVNHRIGEEVRIRIGNSCHIGRGNYFSAGPLIDVGDYFFSGVNCRLLGCGHRIDSPLFPYLGSGLSDGAPIVIEANCWLTTGVTVLEGVRIGRGSVIGAASLVSRSLPPFCVAVGNPCLPVKRFTFRDNAWVPVEGYRDSDEGFEPDENEYRKMLEVSAASIAPSLLPSGRRFGWI